jgi:hypothetical protein
MGFNSVFKGLKCVLRYVRYILIGGGGFMFQNKKEFFSHVNNFHLPTKHSAPFNQCNRTVICLLLLM